MKANSNRYIDMTSGIVWKQLVIYAIPILLGELLQQLYNTADSVVLGNFDGYSAMAAVSATSSVIKMLVGMFNGVSIGCTVVVARFFGQKDYDRLSQSVDTILIISCAMGVLLGVVGYAVTSPILRLMNTPTEVLPEAIRYVQIYFIGVPGLVLYNAVMGVLRAMGDSRRPFLFLLLSSVLNVGLDLLLVAVFRLGVTGAAIATIVTQGLSAILCIILLVRMNSVYSLRVRNMSFRMDIALSVLRIGLPTGFQKSLTSLSNVLLLTYINFFGGPCLAGWGIYTKVSQFVVIAIQSIGSSLSTFISQNVGVKQFDRAHKGCSVALLLAAAVTSVLCVLIYIFRAPIIRAFGDDAETMRYAQLFITGLIFLQLVHVPSTIYPAALRGYGKSVITTVLLMTGVVAARQIYLFFVTAFVNTPLIVGLSYPIGWLVAGVLLYIYYRKRCFGKGLERYLAGGGI